MKKILIINGANLNMTGIREKSVYGSETLEEINAYINRKALDLGAETEFFQSNHEGAIIDTLHGAKVDGIVINPGAYTHYSYAIRDAISSINVPVVEVHMSNVYGRDEFRHKSVTAPVCKGQIAGFGKEVYVLAIQALLGGILV